MSKKIIITTISLILVTLLGVGIYGLVANQPTSAQTPVETITIQHSPPISVNGRQEPTDSTTLKYDATKGNIHDWYVTNNSSVKAGDKLFEYYNPAIEQQITHKQRQLSTLVHMPKPTKESKATSDTLQAEIDELQTHLRTQIVAPISGKLTLTNEHPSKAGEPILSIYSEHKVIKLTLNEEELPLIKEQQTLKIHDQQHQTFKSKVQQVNAFPQNYQSKARTSTYEVQLSTKARYPVGTHFSIEIPRQTIQIPTSALYKKDSVLVKRNNRFIERKIKYYKTVKQNEIIVTEGLNINEKIAKNTKDVA